MWEEAGVRCRVTRRLTVPAGITGLGPEYALVLAEALDSTIHGPQQVEDSDTVYAVSWHEVDEAHPIAGLTPEYWAPLAPLLRELQE